MLNDTMNLDTQCMYNNIEIHNICKHINNTHKMIKQAMKYMYGEHNPHHGSFLNTLEQSQLPGSIQPSMQPTLKMWRWSTRYIPPIQYNDQDKTGQIINSMAIKKLSKQQWSGDNTQKTNFSVYAASWSSLCRKSMPSENIQTKVKKYESHSNKN